MEPDGTRMSGQRKTTKASGEQSEQTWENRVENI